MLKQGFFFDVIGTVTKVVTGGLALLSEYMFVNIIWTIYLLSTPMIELKNIFLYLKILYLVLKVFALT